VTELLELTEKLLEVWEKVELDCGVEVADAVLFVERVVVQRGGESGGVIGRFELSYLALLTADWEWRSSIGMYTGDGNVEDGGR